MTVYNLEENSNIYIAPLYYDNQFEYSMENIIEGQEKRNIIRKIDLRSDKLMIHGVEMKDTLIKMLYESLVMKPGIVIFVNSEGRCYFFMKGSFYKPIENYVFDWSRLGVIVPDSINHCLRKQLEQKEAEIQELKTQLLTCKEDQQELGVKLQKTCEKISLIDFEVELYKIDLESYRKEVEDLLEELSTCREGRRNLEIEFEKAKTKLDECASIKSQLDSSINYANELEEQLSYYKKKSQQMEESRKEDISELVRQLSTSKKEFQDELSYAKSELQSTKNQLEMSKKSVIELEAKLQHKQAQAAVEANEELESAKTTPQEKGKELEHQSRTGKREYEEMEVEVHKVLDDFRTINSIAKSANNLYSYKGLLSMLNPEMVDPVNHSHPTPHLVQRLLSPVYYSMM